MYSLFTPIHITVIHEEQETNATCKLAMVIGYGMTDRCVCGGHF